jgi:hypothetical protein
MSTSFCSDIMIIASSLDQDLYECGVASVEVSNKLLASLKNNARLIANAAFRLAGVMDGDYTIEVGEHFSIFTVQCRAPYAKPEEMDNLFHDFIYGRLTLEEELDLIFSDFHVCKTQMQFLRSQGIPCTVKPFGESFRVAKTTSVNSGFYTWSKDATEITEQARIDAAIEVVVKNMARPKHPLPVLIIRR